MRLKIRCLSPEVVELYKTHGAHHTGDAGLDLFVPNDAIIKAGETYKLKLGVQASAHDEGRNVSFLILPRSSMSKTPLRLANSIGLIDAGYRGELIAALDNIKDYDYTVKKGERLVQAVSFTGREISFELVDTLDETSRGDKGFGSTTTL